MKKGKTMIQVRRGVFESNSSSTHSICIPKKCKNTINHVDFYIGEYGWANDSVDPASYLYTAIWYSYKKDEAQKLLDKIAKILVDNDISFHFAKPTYETIEDYSYAIGYVDHVEELRPFIEAIIKDESMLLRYLSAGKVYTGNDNEDLDLSGCNIAVDDYYDYHKHKYVPNPYHDEENYDYFYKGN